MDTIGSLDRQRRIDLTRTVMRILDDWGIAAEHQVLLLGLPRETRARRLRQFRSDTPFPEEDELLVRVHYLLSIQNAIRTYFPHNAVGSNYWVTTRNIVLGRRTPLEVMIDDGLPGMRRILDILNGEVVQWGED
jgi:hypothetical protein